MCNTFTTIADVIRDRQERGIADLLLSAYDAGYCHAAGIALESPQNTGMADLLTTIAMRHQSEVLALRSWADPPLLADDVPGWLLAQHERRAIEQSAPPEGWGLAPVEGWPI